MHVDVHWDCRDQDEDEEENIRPSVPAGMWKQRNGQLIAISEMTILHLQNAIRLAEQRGCSHRVQGLITEYNRRLAAMDQHKQDRDPIYAAFCAGYTAACTASDQQAYPDVGFSIPLSKNDAWLQYKAKLRK